MVFLRTTKRVLLVVFMLAGLAACATDADQYYSLQPAATVGNAQPKITSGRFDYVVSVRPVLVPTQLDRSQIVLKGRGGDVSVLNASLWASPLPAEIGLAVASGLTQRLGVPDIPTSAVPEGLTAWVVNLDVQRFDSIYNVESVIDLTWRLQSNKGNERKIPVTVCRATISRAAAPGLVPLVDAHRESLQVLAGLMAEQIESAQATGKVAPPASANQLQPGLVFRGCA